MSKTTKLWLALGVTTTLSAGCAKAPEPASPPAEAAGMPLSAATRSGAPDFDKALGKLLGGEGGEGGLGTVYENGRISIPPLSGAQIQQAFTNNTLQQKQDISLQFKADGTFSGVEHPWSKVEPAACEKAGSTPGYELENGECWQRFEVRIPAGKWSVRGDQLCTAPALQQAAKNNECVQVFLVLDKLAFYSTDGQMFGKGLDLVKGGA